MLTRDSTIFFLTTALGLYYHSAHGILTTYPSNRRSLDTADRNFDYVVVGGGPGGLTVANRLSEDASVSVAIVEAGTFYENVTGNQSQVPGYDFHFDGKSPNETLPFVDWGFLTTPQAVRS